MAPNTSYRSLERSLVRSQGIQQIFNKEQQKFLVQDYEGGWNKQAIADALRISLRSAYNHLNRVSIPRLETRSQRVLDEEQHKRLAQHFEDGWTKQAFADTLRIYKKTV